MALVLLTPPASEPLSLAEIKAHLRVDSDHEDAGIAAILAAARASVEGDNGHRFVCQQVLQTLDGFPSFYRQWSRGSGPEITLGAGPLMQFQSIQYTDSEGLVQTVPTTDYTVDAITDPAVVHPYGKYWPGTRAVPNAVQLRYLVGYVNACTADLVTNTITVTGRTPTSGETLYFTNSGGTLPAPLVPSKRYLATSVSGNSCAVTDPDTDVVDLTTAGEGLHFVGMCPPDLIAAIKLMAGHLYENRELVSLGLAVNTIPYGYQRLVSHDPYVRIV